MREVGGMMKPLWSTYLTACTALVFCVDLSEEQQLASSCVEFMKLLQSQNVDNKQIYLVFNKYDAPSTLTLAEVQNMFRLNDASSKDRIRTFVTSAYTGEGTQDLLDSLSANVSY